MLQEEINLVLNKMSPVLDNRQMIKLNKVLDDLFHESEEMIPKSSQELLDSFIATKRLEGRSEQTLDLYRRTVERMLSKFDKNVCVFSTEDVRDYLADYQKSRCINKSTMDNMRRNLSSFFKWLEDENYIFKSPMRRIHKIKTQKIVKEAFTDEEIERLRDGCKCIRDLAIIDLFNSTGIRLGEIVRLNIEDMNFEQRECKVLGKGDKERIAYFDAKTRLHLEEYISTRDDSNPALFVSVRKPATRLTAGGYQLMLRKLGQECDVEQCHAHKFRRTMATKAIDKGMPIEQVQVLLGHEQIATTMFYARVKQSNVKFSHQKYIG